MRKEYWKKVSLLLVAAILLFSGCGTSEEKKSPYEGKWIGLVAETMGVQMSVEEAIGGAFEFEVKKNNKVEFTVGDEHGSGKWSVEENQFTLTIEGAEMTGEIGDNCITFEDMLEMGVKVIFAKDGTDAMDPSLYMTEEEKADGRNMELRQCGGTSGRRSRQTSMEGVENIGDALRLEFKKDHTVAVRYKGQDIGEFGWTIALGYCTIDTENPGIYVTINEDGTLTIDYSDDVDYYTFHCVKSE